MRRSNNLQANKTSEASIKILEKFGTDIKQFAIRFNPDFSDKLRSIQAGYVECFELKYPSLAQIGVAYGTESLFYWMGIQIESFNEFVGVREKLTLEKTIDLCKQIYFEAYFLRISEFSFFIGKLKSGHYGEFYGIVDPLKIMVALNEFLRERNEMLHIHQRKIDEERREKESREWSLKAVTHEEYISLKKKVMSLKKKRKRRGT